MADTVRDRFLHVQERMRAAALRAGREPSSVTLVAVSKTMPAEVIRQALDAGVRILGENRVQEAKEKIAAFPGAAAWHLVGHLQSNKAKLAVQLFEMIHSVDSVKLVQALDRYGREAGKQVRCLVEVNLASETSKSGAMEAEARDLVRAARDLAHVQVDGLMTIPPFLPDPEEVRPYFRRLRALRDTLQGEGCSLPELSMGMTHDFEVAIEEGATLVRIGTAIFGPRVT